MSVLHSRLNIRDPEFAANSEAMRAQVDDLRAVVERIRQGGGEKAAARHTAGVGAARFVLVTGHQGASRQHDGGARPWLVFRRAP